MSEHPLPDDPSKWPRDPFRLLGVARGANERELRKAYHALIRRFKPEHAPEAFRLIRDAYEMAQKFAVIPEFLQGQDEEADEEGEPEVVTDSRHDHVLRLNPGPLAPPRPRNDLDDALESTDGSSYGSLVHRVERGPVPEEVFLELYWLLIIYPGLEPGREPSDWLVRGLLTCRYQTSRLRELLKRELEADPSAAVGKRYTNFVASNTPVDVVRDIASRRWRAARQLGRWGVIIADLKELQTWLPGADPIAWIRILISASGNAVWGPAVIRASATRFRQTAERLAGERAVDISNDLNELEYADAIAKGMSKLGRKGRNHRELRELLSLAWDDRGPHHRLQLAGILRSIAREPLAGLNSLDALKNASPAALGLLWELAGQSYCAWIDESAAVQAELFVGVRTRSNYRAFRRQLLQFCLREMIPPGAIARLLEPHRAYVDSAGIRLGDSIQSDWPLQMVYRACEVSWE